MTDGVLLREVEKVRSAVLALRLLAQLSTTPPSQQNMSGVWRVGFMLC